MSSSLFDLDNVVPEMRYAPSAQRAAENMHLLMREEVMQPAELEWPLATSSPSTHDTRPVSATRAMSKLQWVAAEIATLTYGDLMELAGYIWAHREVGELTERAIADILWDWAVTYKK